MIPSIVLGEFLTGLDVSDHAKTLALLTSSFEILPYDVQAAAVFAKLWRDKDALGNSNHCHTFLKEKKIVYGMVRNSPILFNIKHLHFEILSYSHISLFPASYGNVW